MNSKPSAETEEAEPGIRTRWRRLGPAMPDELSCCTLDTGYSEWHRAAAGLMARSELEKFWESTRDFSIQIITVDLWEHTWDAPQFEYFCLEFEGKHNTGCALLELQRILVGRTPAEIAYLADVPFPVPGTPEKLIKPSGAVAKWAELISYNEKF